MSMPPPDRRVVACNYLEGTGVAAAGAFAYVVPVCLGGNLPERIEVLVRSRGGRWVRKWEATKRLGRFRAKTLPPEHPRYADDRMAHMVWAHYDDARLERLVEILDRYAKGMRREAERRTERMMHPADSGPAE